MFLYVRLINVDGDDLDDDDLTEASPHIIAPVVTTTSITLSYNKTG